VGILTALAERIRRLDALGPRPSAWFEPLTSRFSRSPKDPVNKLRNDIESFSTELHREASEKGLNLAQASDGAGVNRFRQFERDLNELVQRVSQSSTNTIAPRHLRRALSAQLFGRFPVQKKLLTHSAGFHATD
jgi:hypothetical protein